MRRRPADRARHADEPEQPIGLEAQDDALYDNVLMTVGATEPSGFDGTVPDPVPGTGAPLKLVEKAPVTEDDLARHAEGYTYTDVTADNTADFSLTRAQLEGKVGDKVTASVKFANEGPAWVYREPGHGAVAVDVRIRRGPRS